MPPKKKFEGEDRRVDVESLTINIKAVIAIIVVVVMIVGGAFFWQYQVKQQGENIEDNATTIEELNTELKKLRVKFYQYRSANEKEHAEMKAALDKKSDKIF